MTCKFIELHDSDNEPILINPSWIACIEKNEDEGCSVRLGIYSNGELLILSMLLKVMKLLRICYAKV